MKLAMLSYKKFKQSDFYQFFNITETKKEESDAHSLVTLKSGAHQQHINYFFSFSRE